MFLVYGKADCPWCTRAMEKLDELSLHFTYVMVGEDITREEFYRLMGKNPDKDRLTVPQIFDGKHYVGTYENLVEYLGFHDTYLDIGC